MSVDPRLYDFNERLVWSNGFLNGGIERILRDRIPACLGVCKADRNSDRNGTDYWAQREGLPPLSIDVKIRDEDYRKRGFDDLALETWSVIDIKPGWTRDTSKRTDYVLWFWQDTRRFFICAFPPLCRVFRLYWQEWRDEYRTAVQSSGAWQSECVFVPRLVVMDRLKAWQYGEVPVEEMPFA